MEKNYLKKVIETEERVNKLVEVLALSPASHFQVRYNHYEIELTAFANNKDEAQLTGNLMRVFASSTDKMEMEAHENEDGGFWTISLSIPIKED